MRRIILVPFWQFYRLLYDSGV